MELFRIELEEHVVKGEGYVTELTPAKRQQIEDAEREGGASLVKWINASDLKWVLVTVLG